MNHFDFNDFTIQFSMLHDQTLTDVSVESGVLRLIFGEYEIFREDYTDATYYDRYKDYKECTVEIILHHFALPDMDTLSLCMLKGDRFTYLEIDRESLVDLLTQIRPGFTFASISNNDEIEMQLLSSDERHIPRRYRDCEFRLGAFADAIRFIWS